MSKRRLEALQHYFHQISPLQFFPQQPDHFNKNIEMDFIVEVHFGIFSLCPALGLSLSRDTPHIGVKDPLNVDRDINGPAPGNQPT